MPRSVYNWTPEDVVRFLKEHGFSLNYSRGSHFYYVGYAEKQFRQVCIPFHGSKAIKPRTLKGMILQSGISKKEWFQWRK